MAELQTPSPPSPQPLPPEGQRTFPPPAALQYARTEPWKQQSNPLATASLVMGVLLFVPFLTSAAAVVLGRLGLKRAGEVGGAGRGPAKAGLVLGFIGLGLWVVL